MRKIKILRVIARLNIGGPAIHVILLSAGIDKKRFESILVYGTSGRNESDMLYYAASKNIQPVYLPELKRSLSALNDFFAFLKLFRLICSEKPDIVHTHTAKAGALGRGAAILYNLLHFYKTEKIKIIHTFHGHVFGGYFGKLKTDFFIFIEKLLAFFSDVIITVSESTKRELLAYKISEEKKIRVVHLGLELEPFLNHNCARQGEALNVGIIGRLVPIKNHGLFLEAAKQTIYQAPELKLKFKIIGDGELREQLEEYCRKLELCDSVEFLGWQRDLVKTYAELDILALTSLNEGTPVSLIEGMACTKTVIATDVGGVRDLLGKNNTAYPLPMDGFEILQNGILVKPGNATFFANALNLALRNKELRENLSKNARESVRLRFNKTRLLTDIENLYSGFFLL